MQDQIEVFDWKRIFFNNNLEFLYEGAFRSAVMFIILMVILRISGNRGIKQLSVFELAVLIALGSAAGDPMISHDSAILPSIVCFIIVLGIYRIAMVIINRSRKMEEVLEGKPICLLEDGVINTKAFKKEDMAYDEFFSELRISSVEHLGQVRRVYLETSSELSVFFFNDEDVRPGLPILPELYDYHLDSIPQPDTYSCVECGVTLEIKEEKKTCPNCSHDKWLKSLSTKRIT